MLRTATRYLLFILLVKKNESCYSDSVDKRPGKHRS